ncbi:nudix-type nucleoside diphosphatase, YffH/AdpP family protein (plasmid) [Ochrobactrum quorumnocens]|uniref:Nudix-type nucleoside diphosphatase, YffH/AdpP family protein n=1 Tax=Ochrobactrum quorumnocens TaxID=271865 RepID=A0A248UQZ9_9HYPH|nr:nudix-type nucleoside diphosphatase, YffH/AdpP family protein [[Ochrobactrum] quorumnocens]
MYNPASDNVLLTRQFRLPVLLNGGLESLIEAPAGLLEGADPAERMRAELMEETGYKVFELTHLYDVYMSPGSVTEYLAFFYGEYAESDKVGAGGGSVAEGEDIDVLEVTLSKAMQMISCGDIRDAKTIILLQHLTIRLLQEKYTTLEF